jgi:hypothetical protein
MPKFLKYLVQLPPLLIALLFGAQGAVWLINPAAAARGWGFALPEDGFGLSSMIGAMAGYGLTIGICLLVGIVRKERVWYYAPAMLFLFLGVGRLVAGLFFGAPHMPERYLAEFVIAGLLLFASRSGR